MTGREENGVWRDEERLPLSELGRAMATSDVDGQNDPTDNDAGEEQAFGHDAQVRTEPGGTDPDRGARPGPAGRSGPH